MNRQERERPGRPETRALKFILAVEEAVQRMFACGLPRKEAKGTSSTRDESVRVGDPDNAGTAGTGRQEPRWMRT
jgi:hypothetical protein